MSREVNLVIGAGQAGANAVFAMREAGFSGAIVLVGEESHLPYERPPLSKDMLTAREAPNPSMVRKLEAYVEEGIELRLGVRAEGILADRGRVELSSGDLIGYDRLLLATGGRARRLGIKGDEYIHYLRTLDEARRLRDRLRSARRVVCIGAGVIGLEIAASARSLGCEVTVLEAGQGAMERALSPELSRFMRDLHETAGVKMLFGQSVEAVRSGTDNDFTVITRAGLALRADCVVAGIGLERDLSLAESAGLKTANGIEVDAFGAASLPGIYAAGDIAAFWHPLFNARLRLENWRHAQNHGIAVGRTLGGDAAPYADLPWFWSDQFGVNLQVCGLPLQGNETIMRGDPARRDFLALHLDGGGRVVAATTANRPREMRGAMALIQSNRPVDRAMAGDESIALKQLAAD